MGTEMAKEIASEIAAQCWGDPRTSDKDMDIVLGEVFAEKLAGWIDIAAQNQRNTDYYRGLLVKCGELIGIEAYTQDDGGVVDDVLCAKIPELVEKLCSQINQITKIVYNQ